MTELRADCTRCFALCCVVPAFAASADFAISKPAGHPCPHLGADHRCGIHAELRPRGFPGCAAYDCFGAGQRVSAGALAGRDWRADRLVLGQAVEIFPVVRQLHELLWYLTGALELPAARPLHAELRRALTRTERLAGGDPESLRALDLAAHGRQVDDVLRRTSALVRGDMPDPRGRDLRGPDPVGRDLRGPDLVGRVLRGADLVGRDLHGADLRGADLRGALLLGADLRGADLRLADLIGADLRAADLGGADLTGALFVTRPQLAAAHGDGTTRLPAGLGRPPHWSRTVEP